MVATKRMPAQPKEVTAEDVNNFLQNEVQRLGNELQQANANIVKLNDLVIIGNERFVKMVNDSTEKEQELMQARRTVEQLQQMLSQYQQAADNPGDAVIEGETIQ